jgi:hypothetical protein
MGSLARVRRMFHVKQSGSPSTGWFHVKQSPGIKFVVPRETLRSRCDGGERYPRPPLRGGILPLSPARSPSGNRRMLVVH